jgi:hypothetical protein
VRSAVLELQQMVPDYSPGEEISERLAALAPVNLNPVNLDPVNLDLVRLASAVDAPDLTATDLSLTPSFEESA